MGLVRDIPPTNLSAWQQLPVLMDPSQKHCCILHQFVPCAVSNAALARCYAETRGSVVLLEDVWSICSNNACMRAPQREAPTGRGRAQQVRSPGRGCLRPCASQWVQWPCASQWMWWPNASQWVQQPCASQWVLWPHASQWV